MLRNKKAVAPPLIIIAVIAISIFILILVANYNGYVTRGDEKSFNHQVPLELCKLPTLTSESINSYEAYKNFADKIDDAITILNNNQQFNIPNLGTTYADYDKILKFLTEYEPLIKNYNDLIISADTYNKSRADVDLQNFYIAGSHFAFELTVISATVFYTASYQTVGAIYRASGLTTLATECPSCVSVVLSTTHWTIRNGLVEMSSQFAKEITDNPKEKWDSITIESLKEKGNSVLDSTKILPLILQTKLLQQHKITIILKLKKKLLMLLKEPQVKLLKV